MNDYRIHLNYAKALFLLAHDLGETEAVTHDMELVGEVCKDNHLLNKIMANPTIKEDRKRAIVNDIFAAHVGATTMAFLLFVVHRRRGVNLRGIASSYMELYREANNIVLAHVTTASDMDDELIGQLRQKVADFTNKKVIVDHKVSDKMLGGFEMTFDTYLVDGRLYSRIDRMKREFSKNVYESKL